MNNQLQIYKDSNGRIGHLVTIDKLRSRQRVHASRNPLLARVLVDVGIMREEGEGIPRIFKEMEESLLCQPEFSIETSTFCVTLKNEPIYTGHSPAWEMLIDRFRAHKRLTNQEYCRVFGVIRNTATRELKRLCDEGFLVAAGVRKGAHYVTGSMLNRLIAP